jgi:hypothetical protein
MVGSLGPIAAAGPAAASSQAPSAASISKRISGARTSPSLVCLCIYPSWSRGTGDVPPAAPVCPWWTGTHDQNRTFGVAGKGQ